MYELKPCPSLKTCPFCGGDARQRTFHGKSGWFVDTICLECRAMVTSPISEEREIAKFESTMKWNRRAEDVPTL